jgi:hypothetical protein
VMRINVKITVGMDIEIDQTMAGNLVEHMVEEGNARGQRARPRAIEVESRTAIRMVGGR